MLNGFADRLFEPMLKANANPMHAGAYPRTVRPADLASANRISPAPNSITCLMGALPPWPGRELWSTWPDPLDVLLIQVQGS